LDYGDQGNIKREELEKKLQTTADVTFIYIMQRLQNYTAHHGLDINRCKHVGLAMM
jgi:hypothetical protein